MLALLADATLGAYDNFPVKSVNMPAATAISFWKTHSLADGHPLDVEDAHPVYGLETSDGGFVFVGKGLVSGISESFAVKFSATGAYVWGWKSATPTTADAANSAVQLPPSGAIIVAGYRDVGGVNSRCLWKLG